MLVPPPDWVSTSTDWYCWSWEHRVGIPARQHRELYEASEAWRLKSVRATEDGDQELAIECHLQSCVIGQQLVEVMESHVGRRRRRR